MKKIHLLLALLTMSLTFGQDHKAILTSLDKEAERFANIALTIWDYAEMGYQEEKSSALLQETLAQEGFTIKKGVAGIPTAFIAEYNNGGP